MPVPDLEHRSESYPKLAHVGLETTFCGVELPSTTDARVHQYLGIKYANIPGRFLRSRLCSKYPTITDASKHGPICPQLQLTKSTEELLFGIPQEEIPVQDLKQNEFECLNLNITSPAGLTPRSRVPVMLWVHGGGDRGSGSNWIYDGANLVRKSVSYGKPVIIVTFNFRLGLLGSAASPSIREDNKLAGDEGVGNYGLRDQRVAMQWVHRYIGEFGGDPHNVTLFGSGSGAADIVCHLLSRENETQPLFQRSIIQSAIFEPILPDVGNAGWHLSRIMSSLQVSTVEKFRNVDVEKLLRLGQTIRVVNDGVWFREGWQSYFNVETAHAHAHHLHREQLRPTSRVHHGVSFHPPISSRSRSRSKSALRTSLRSTSRSRSPLRDTKKKTSLSLQPLIIGDNSCDSLLWSIPISLWNSDGVVRRLKAICQSLSKTSGILRAYDLSSSTPDHEIIDRVLELVNDARVGWPTEQIAVNAKHERGGHNVWRYVFDQEGFVRGVPHHVADLMYLFDNVPLPAACSTTAETEVYFEGLYDNSDDEEDLTGSSIKYDPVTIRTTDEDEWGTAIVDEYAYNKVKDALQEKWISFAHGETPWKDEKIFVFGPEGETGERSTCIFEGRRRRMLWKEAFEPLGSQLVQKLGVELSRGPAPGHA